MKQKQEKFEKTVGAAVLEDGKLEAVNAGSEKIQGGRPTASCDRCADFVCKKCNKPPFRIHFIVGVPDIVCPWCNRAAKCRNCKYYRDDGYCTFGG